MDESMRATIETLTAKVEAKAKELAELKRTVNFLSKEAGGDPVYDVEQTSGEVTGYTAIRADQFYGKSPIVAAREYLESRGRAVTAEEVVDALARGGFDFDEQGWKKPDRVRSMAISLSKNTAIFHRLPNGTYGLVKFYPAIRAEKKEKKATDNGDTESEPAENEEPKTESA